VDDARLLMRHVDSELGRALPEKSYGGNCLIYDDDRPDDPYHNFWVLLHIILIFFLTCKQKMEQFGTVNSCVY